MSTCVARAALWGVASRMWATVSAAAGYSVPELTEPESGPHCWSSCRLFPKGKLDTVRTAVDSVFNFYRNNF